MLYKNYVCFSVLILLSPPIFADQTGSLVWQVGGSKKEEVNRATPRVADAISNATTIQVFDIKVIDTIGNATTQVFDTKVIEAIGNVTITEVLIGKTFSNQSSVGLTGIMPNHGAITYTPTTMEQPIATGYHDGSSIVRGNIRLIPDNIRKDTNIFGITGNIIEATGNATAAEVLNGKNFSNSSSARLIGTMPNHGAVKIAPTTIVQPIAAGYHNVSGRVKGDSNLIPENIRKGVTIDGVTGTFSGETTTVTQSSEKCDSDPSPRYINNKNGTVTDNHTKLIWLRNASCFDLEYWEKVDAEEENYSFAKADNEVPKEKPKTVTQDWEQAVKVTKNLRDGQCGLSDGSKPKTWRLPTIKEWEEMVNKCYERPVLSNEKGDGQWIEGDAFVGVKMDNYYWSSAPLATNNALAWYMVLSVGSVGFVNKTNSFYVWPVKKKE
jgi:hypothetical protein